MPELRKDLIRDSWVVIATDRALKPNDFPINKMGMRIESSNNMCPFCEGNEAFTTSEITAVRPGNTPPDGPGWVVRTIPNKFSAFQLQGELELGSNGVYNNCNGLGQHEVVVETPEHGVEFHQLTVERTELVYQMLQQRYDALASDPRIKYIQIYKNRGLFAGASLEHSHSQVLAFPMVPQNNRGMAEYYHKQNKCVLCDMIAQEKQENQRIICESDNFLVICPYASRFSYETWVIPKRHIEHFTELEPAEVKDLAKISQEFINGMLDCLNNPSYNIVINSAPVNVPYEKGYHCFMEITPRLIVAAGVEVATGIYMNPVAPELSAVMLREKWPAK